MRVLIAHNRYRSAWPSGENRVVDQDLELLRSAGVDVTAYIRSSDEIDGYGAADRLALLARPVFSRRSWNELDQLIEHERPDVIHLHNPFPLVSPAIIRLAARRRIPIVQSVHNFRHVCPAGTHLRDGRVCLDCSADRFPVPCVVHGCYRGSRTQSAVMSLALSAHRTTWNKLDRLLPVSGFVGERLRAAGFAADRIIVHPNAVTDPGTPTPLGEGFVFLGRLDATKGIDLLAAAWRASGLDGRLPLTIAGDGPLRSFVEGWADTSRSVRFRGAVDPSEAGSLIDRACAVVVPSRWFEALPMTVLEAFARGRPVLATDLGALASLVDDRTGWRFEATVSALAEALVRAAGDRRACLERGAAAREVYLGLYTPEQRVRRAIRIYGELLASSR